MIALSLQGCSIREVSSKCDHDIAWHCYMWNVDTITVEERKLMLLWGVGWFMGVPTFAIFFCD